MLIHINATFFSTSNLFKIYALTGENKLYCLFFNLNYTKRELINKINANGTRKCQR